MSCDQCQVLSINGTPTHETGCPNAWKHPITDVPYPVECFHCGCEYAPEEAPPHRTTRICPSCIEDERNPIESCELCQLEQRSDDMYHENGYVLCSSCIGSLEYCDDDECSGILDDDDVCNLCGTEWERVGDLFEPAGYMDDPDPFDGFTPADHGTHTPQIGGAA